ncbi:MAG: glycosyltransferase family 2 protein [Candidatus Hydrogenedentes bacterium]|nr:glycosyltransferase family 2 protein [Candidatus Hydrogenedentota bacterium]
MNVCIGILAHNEASVIANTIRHLAAQSLIASPQPADYCVEVICVPNGCTDDTAEIARQECARAEAVPRNRSVSFSVEEVDEPGKCNAWNRFIHEFADPKTDYFILMDADTQCGQPDTLERLLLSLVADPFAYATVDTPLKDFSQKTQKTPLEWFSTQVSSAAFQGHLAGSLYCIRGEIARRMWFPGNIPVEDGLLTKMLITNFLTEEPNKARIIHVPGTSHYFQAILSLRTIMRHEKRIVLGSFINECILDHIAAHRTEAEDAAVYLKRQMNENSHWLHETLKVEFAKRRMELILNSLSLRHLRKLRGLPVSQKALRFLPLLAKTALGSISSISAYMEIKYGNPYEYW